MAFRWSPLPRPMALAYREAAAGEEVGSSLLPQSRRNVRFRRSPVGVERAAAAIDIDDQRCVIPRYTFSLPRLAIGLIPDDDQ